MDLRYDIAPLQELAVIPRRNTGREKQDPAWLQQAAHAAKYRKRIADMLQNFNHRNNVEKTDVQILVVQNRHAGLPCSIDEAAGVKSHAPRARIALDI